MDDKQRYPHDLSETPMGGGEGLKDFSSFKVIVFSCCLLLCYDHAICPNVHKHKVVRSSNVGKLGKVGTPVINWQSVVNILASTSFSQFLARAEFPFEVAMIFH